MRAKSLRGRKLGAFAATALLAFAVTAVGAGATPMRSAAPMASSTLRIAVTQAMPDAFDPPLIFSNADLNVAPNVFQGLISLGNHGKILPAIAKSWKVSKNGLTYTFRLRKNARFYNGDRVTASDFVYSIDRALTPQEASPIGFYLTPIVGAADVESGKATHVTGVSAIGKYGLTNVHTKPQGNFLQVLTRPVAWVVDPKTIEKYGSGAANPPHVNGTGPYTLSSRTANTNFVFTANPKYWGKKPRIKRVTLTVVPDSTAALARFQSGEFDVVDSLSSASVLQALSNSSLRKEFRSTAQSRTDWLGMRTDSPPFDKLDVRLAFEHAIDKNTLVKIAMGGLATPAKDWLPIGLGGNISKSWAGYDFNPAKARSLLAAGGYPNGANFPHVTIYYSTDMAGIAEQTLELVQQQLKTNLGVDVGLRNMPRQALTATLNNRSQRSAIWAWTFGADIPDATTITTFFGLTGAPFNWEIWSNPSYDATINRAAATASLRVRNKLFARAELIRMKAALIIPLYYPNETWVVTPHVSGFGLWNHSTWVPFSSISLR